MKNLILVILFLVGLSTNSHSQTYYNPSNKVDFTITIKESYKPVDYSKIGRDFNTMIQNELQRRENLKRYYDEIYFQTKNSVYSSTVLTSDNLINSKILMVQQEVIERLDIYNRLLKSGMVKPNEYESDVRNIYYTYMNTNQVFLQIVQYKYNKDLELSNQTKINEHNKLYTNTLNSIKEFRFNNSGDIEFVLNGLIYPNTTTNSLYDFVRSSSEGGFTDYKEKFEVEEKKKKEEELFQKNEYQRIYDLRRSTFDLRKSILIKLTEKEKRGFREEEKEYILNGLENLYLENKVKYTPKTLKGIWERIFSTEDLDFRFVSLFYFDTQDPLLDPENFVWSEIYFNLIKGFSESKNPNN
uniref:hypothetical protein n=1 Tax=Algoriphagus sp. TaxID=1872435 RepID=UPI0040472793